MTKKQKALDEARKSGNKALEGGKEFGKGSLKVVGKTVGALGYTLLSGGEAVASKISENREPDEGISLEEKRRRKINTLEYKKRAKKHIVKAGNIGKGVVGGAWQATKGGVKVIGHSAKAGYHLIDAGDKAIGEYIEKKQLEKGKQPGKLKKAVRDNIMKIMMVLSAAGYGAYEGGKYIMNNNNEEGQEIIVETNDLNSNETLVIPMDKYKLLKGKTITTSAPLTRWYLGGDLENKNNLVIGDTITLNSAEALHNLRTKKIEQYGQYTNDISKLDSIDAACMTPEEIEKFRVKYPVDATYLFVAKPYIDGKENKGKMTLNQFVSQTNQLIKTLKSDTEVYDGGLTGAKKDLFNAIREDINGKCIVAYAMTELGENKKDGEFNKEVFDVLLQNAGVNFLSNVPAVYDGKTSYGLYQFTEYALHDNKGDVRGASVVNRKLPKDKRIPGSVIDLKTWQEQTKAAYMFALNNLNSAVRKLTDEQAKDMLKYQKNNKENFRDNITQLIAMCHHMPVAAGFLKKWHEGGYKQDIYIIMEENIQSRIERHQKLIMRLGNRNKLVI